MERAVIYARISRDRSGDALGVQRQLADCQALAAENGYDIVATEVDNDISAYSGKRRPGYESLLHLVERKSVDVVVVWHTDRLHRSPKELERYIDLCEANGRVRTETVKAGSLDLATPSGRLIARQLGSLARYESEHKGERISAKRRQAAVSGIWQGGPRPFGWNIVKHVDSAGRVTHDITLNETEAGLIEWAYGSLIEGGPISGIVTHFQESGVPAPRGKMWRHSTVRSLLTRTRNFGVESIKGEELGKSQFPAIVDETTYRRALQRIKDPARRTHDDNQVRHLLSGIARCHCGEAMAVSISQGKPVYACGSSRYPATRRKDVKHATRIVEELDRFVLDVWPYAVRGEASSFRLYAANEHDSRQERERELAALRAQSDDLLDMWTTRAIDRAQFERANGELRARMRAIEEGLLTAQPSELNYGWNELHPSQIRDYLMEQDLHGRRRLLRESVTITVYPTNRQRFSRILEDERAWPHVDIKPLPSEDGRPRAIYWAPSKPPVWDEHDEEVGDEEMRAPIFPRDFPLR